MLKFTWSAVSVSLTSRSMALRPLQKQPKQNIVAVSTISAAHSGKNKATQMAPKSLAVWCGAVDGSKSLTAHRASLIITPLSINDFVCDPKSLTAQLRETEAILYRSPRHIVYTRIVNSRLMEHAQDPGTGWYGVQIYCPVIYVCSAVFAEVSLSKSISRGRANMNNRILLGLWEDSHLSLRTGTWHERLSRQFRCYALVSVDSCAMLCSYFFLNGFSLQIVDLIFWIKYLLWCNFKP